MADVESISVEEGSTSTIVIKEAEVAAKASAPVEEKTAGEAVKGEGEKKDAGGKAADGEEELNVDVDDSSMDEEIARSKSEGVDISDEDSQEGGSAEKKIKLDEESDAATKEPVESTTDGESVGDVELNP